MIWQILACLNLPSMPKLPNVTVVPLETDQECAQAIAAGREDFVGYVTSETVVDANIAAGLPVVKLGGPVYSEDLAAAFDKIFHPAHRHSLRAEVDKLFTAMHADGRSPNSRTNGLDGSDPGS